MDSNFEYSLAQVLKSEGGYVNNPKDPGGETNMGITKNAWSTWLKRPIKDGEMAQITHADVIPFYKALYWNKAYCPQLPTGIDYMAFDGAVNMGVGQSIRLLQKSLGCVPDGVIGPNTMNAIQNGDRMNIITKYAAQREQFYRSLALFQTFGQGWLNRNNYVLQTAKAMV